MLFPAVGKTSSRVLIRDLEVMISIGCNAAELQKKQRVTVNVTLDVQINENWRKDSIGDVLSYADIVSFIEGIAAEGHIHLVETFAERIIDACLKDRRVNQACVRVEKPDIFDHAKAVGAEITRSR